MTTRQTLLALIRRLAPAKGIGNSETGACVWCDGGTFQNHFPTCPWVQAQEILKDAG